MAWQVIAQGNSLEEFKQARPTMSEVPVGSDVLIRVELVTWAPLGKLADIAGAEWWAQRLFSEIQVIDVYGDWYWMEIKGVARGMAPVILIALVVAGLAALGWGAWIFKNIQISADVREREKAKIEFIEEMETRGYSPETITRWLEGIESPPPEIKLPDWALPAGIGIGTLLLVGLGAILLLRK